MDLTFEEFSATHLSAPQVITAKRRRFSWSHDVSCAISVIHTTPRTVPLLISRVGGVSQPPKPRPLQSIGGTREWSLL